MSLSDALYAFDLTVFRAINTDLRSPILTPVMHLLSLLGLGGVQAALALTLWRSPKTRQMVVPLLVSILIAGLPVAQLLKKLLPRERPSRMMDTIREEAWFGNSFPSGHTSTSFAVAVMVLLLTRGTRYAPAGPISLVVAALVGVSRMYRGVHWPTDVLGGALGGTFSACLVYLVMSRVGSISKSEEAA